MNRFKQHQVATQIDIAKIVDPRSSKINSRIKNSCQSATFVRRCTKRLTLLFGTFQTIRLEEAENGIVSNAAGSDLFLWIFGFYHSGRHFDVTSFIEWRF